MAAPKGRKFPGTPLQVVTTEEMSERIAQIAKAERVSKASVVRDIIEAGIVRREKKAGITYAPEQ